MGGAAIWNVKCKGGCGEDLAPLKTSAPLYNNDFEINHALNFGAVTCAVPFQRLNQLLRTVGCATARSTPVSCVASPLACSPAPRQGHATPRWSTPYQPTGGGGGVDGGAIYVLIAQLSHSTLC